jgi:hypothetical protein
MPFDLGGRFIALTVAAMLFAGSAMADSFDYGPIKGSLDAQLTTGIGVRTASPNCGLVGDPATCASGANTGQSSGGDNGDLNYRNGQVFSAYSKLTPELLVHLPENQVDFMARGSFIYDFAAADTQRTELGSGAQDQIVRNGQLYDLWVAKSFDVNDSSYRVRLGNQVINWGESLFLYGGINATNAIDYQKSLIPGTQIKEYVLPAPMVSVAGNVAKGWNVESYYQFAWNETKFPPIGSYWSTSDFLGQGNRDIYTLSQSNYNAFGLDPAGILRQQGVTGRISQGQINGIAQQILNPNTFGAFGQVGGLVLDEKKPSDQGQFGISAHYKPEGSVIDTGFYYLRYHDKSPVMNLVADSNVSAGNDYQSLYRENRDLFGLSTNFPLGNWAIGSELSYRPRDAIALSGCYLPGAAPNANNFGVAGGPASFANGQACPLWRDNQKYELHLTGLLQLTPSDAPTIMEPLRADTALLSVEFVGVDYPGIGRSITRNINGQTVVQLPDAGYVNWLDSSGNPKTVGTDLSGGAIADFNWTYDGSVISGWQLTPGVTYFNALFGQTPTPGASYMSGAQSLNFYLLLNQNPATWQVGVNYTTFFGGNEPWTQPYRDRDFVGAFVTRNF